MTFILKQNICQHFFLEEIRSPCLKNVFLLMIILFCLINVTLRHIICMDCEQCLDNNPA